MEIATPAEKRPHLTPAQRHAAQRTFHIFSLFNICSFQFLSGNLITLYALRVGLGSMLIGVLFSFIPLAQLMPIIARPIVTRIGTVRTMGLFWIARYVLATPILAVSLFADTDRIPIAVTLLFIGVLGFNIARGAGMTGMQPVIGHVTTIQDRGLFMSRMQLLIHGVIVITGVLMGLILDQKTPLFVFNIILTVGLITGAIATYYVFRLPELPREVNATPLLRNILTAIQDATVLRFMLLTCAVFAGVFMAQPFFIVFLHQVYGLGDNTIMLLTVVGSLGAICMALLSGLMTDRIGAQPLLVVSTSVLSAVMLPLVVAPPLIGFSAWIYGAAAYFLFMIGACGLQSASTVYFLSICKSEERLNLGILFLLCTGLGGTVGSLVGGILLDLLQLGLGTAGSFRAFFALLAVLFTSIALGMNGLERLGAYRARDVLSMMFSIRDLRAIGLLNRLHRVRSPFEEQRVIQELGSSRSRVTARDLILKLSSPRFAVRAEALTALHSVETGDELIPVLIAEIRNHNFTTAYLAAELAGRKGIAEVIPALRESVNSHDHFLVGKATVALAQLGDRESLPEIERLLDSTENPRLIIHSATALELFGSPTSVPILIAKLHRKFSPHVRDELILAIAEILGIGGFLYPHYRSFIESSSAGIEDLRDELAQNHRANPLQARVEELLDLMNSDRTLFAQTASRLLSILPETSLDKKIAEHLLAGLSEPEIVCLDRFCFLVVALATSATKQAIATIPAAPSGDLP